MLESSLSIWIDETEEKVCWNVLGTRAPAHTEYIKGQRKGFKSLITFFFFLVFFQVFYKGSFLEINDLKIFYWLVLVERSQQDNMVIFRKIIVVRKVTVRSDFFFFFFVDSLRHPYSKLINDCSDLLIGRSTDNNNVRNLIECVV